MSCSFFCSIRAAKPRTTAPRAPVSKHTFFRFLKSHQYKKYNWSIWKVLKAFCLALKTSTLLLICSLPDFQRSFYHISYEIHTRNPILKRDHRRLKMKKVAIEKKIILNVASWDAEDSLISKLSLLKVTFSKKFQVNCHWQDCFALSGIRLWQKS